MKLLVIGMLLVSWLFGAVDLNNATKEELMSVKGIGEAKAQAIIDYRKAKPFKSVDELSNVNGFGKKSVEKLKGELSVSSTQTDKAANKQMPMDNKQNMHNGHKMMK